MDKSYMWLVGSVHRILRLVLHLKTLFRYKYWASDCSFTNASGNRVYHFSYANRLFLHLQGLTGILANTRISRLTVNYMKAE